MRASEKFEGVMHNRCQFLRFLKNFYMVCGENCYTINDYDYYI
ncbi:Uncharacterized protein BN1224_CV14_A_01800 [Chlamydia pneumoniae]|uniref:Uncharacterized protein n=1 Tax=Chlamydia pneumoniae TaxID=83558 RepID=Q9K237_CHLPN|nr:hypothetical protein CP_0596 [Chlamydia pneumoniae AR39]CRI35534.1 Uncharacterized protein BN1224_CM1_A_01810 [Chlamydia pneumoniae]CRI36661.1 Uncharacterized protein BN1224_CV14_A_01800 [Chlamydia pneumoniae]CRI41181.1 Uncharacterized protein BN1224_GiD_A_01820 [Chlamydia pneumoniae]CRI46776.1 Uncharacterized protein BN1224_Panola_B_01150 [Chlamydia pneumoniae]